jgi:hypothetical protein
LILRRIGAVILGLAVAWLIVAAAEAGVHHLYPPSAGTDMHDFAAVKSYVANLPLAAFVLVLVGWLFGAFAGVFIATTVGRGALSGYILGVLLLAAGIVNAVMIPQPVWFSAFSLLIYIVATVVGVKIGQGAIPSVAE